MDLSEMESTDLKYYLIKLQEYCSSIGSAFVVFFIIHSFLLFCYLFFRFIRIRFGQRIRADPKKAVLVTGATSGLGLCLAKRLHKLGFTVFAAYYSELEPGYAELIEQGKSDPTGQERMFMVPLDVSSSDSIEKCHSIVEKHLADYQLKLYSLVNNAGCSFDGSFEWSEPESINKVIRINIDGCIKMSRQFVKRIILDQGRFVQVASGITVIPTKSLSVYGATKAGVAYFSEALHCDLEPYGASSYCILPANLITSTNIAFTRLRGAQDSASKLTEEERRIYERSIEKGILFHQELVRRRIIQAGYKLEEVERCYGLNLDFMREERAERQKAKGSCWFNSGLSKALHKLLGCILIIATGESLNPSIENSGALIAFEAALLMRSPPLRIYLGSWLFTFVVGPSAEYLPRILFNSLSSISYKSFAARTMRR